MTQLVLRLPISCNELRYILLFGITAVFCYSLYSTTIPLTNEVHIVLAVMGLVLGGIGTGVGWTIWFIEKNPVSIRCKCDND